MAEGVDAVLLQKISVFNVLRQKDYQMANKEFIAQNRINVLLKEYDSQRQELFNHLNHARQILTLVLGSISIVLPLLLQQIINLPSSILLGFLYFLAIVYSVISMNAATLQFNIDVMGYYIHNHIEPELNEILPDRKFGRRILYWETFLRAVRSRPMVLYVNIIGSIGTILLLTLPAGISLLIAEYIVKTSVDLNSSFPVLVLNVIIGVKWFAWILYIMSLVGWIFIVLIDLFELRLIKKK